MFPVSASKKTFSCLENRKPCFFSLQPQEASWSQKKVISSWCSDSRDTASQVLEPCRVYWYHVLMQGRPSLQIILLQIYQCFPDKFAPLC